MIVERSVSRPPGSPARLRDGGSTGATDATQPRHIRHGLECPQQVVFGRWQPGQEYTRGLQLKNVSGEAVTLRHQAHSGAAFSLPYPEAVKLRPGMSHVLQVGSGAPG
jgi:hypothetical protein